MNLYLLLGVLSFASLSTFFLWFKVYSLDRKQGLLTLLIYFPILPVIAWAHKEKCKVHLTVWLISMLLLMVSIAWLFI